MNAYSYFLISGIFFAAVAVIHLFRLIYGWAFTIGDFSAPMYVSVFGLLIPAALSAWGLRLSRKSAG